LFLLTSFFSEIWFRVCIWEKTHTFVLLSLAYFIHNDLSFHYFLQIMHFHSSLWLNNTPVCVSTTFSLFIHQLMAFVTSAGIKWFWNKSRHVAQWIGKEQSEIHSHSHRRLTFNKESKATH
jgi:hypothetical protein